MSLSIEIWNLSFFTDPTFLDLCVFSPLITLTPLLLPMLIGFSPTASICNWHSLRLCLPVSRPLRLLVLAQRCLYIGSTFPSRGSILLSPHVEFQSRHMCVCVRGYVWQREGERAIERGSSWPAVTHDHSINIRGRKSQRSGKRDTVCVCLCLDRFACVNTTLTVSGKTGDLRRYFVKYSIMIDETERR